MLKSIENASFDGCKLQVHDRRRILAKLRVNVRKLKEILAR